MTSLRNPSTPPTTGSIRQQLRSINKLAPLQRALIIIVPAVALIAGWQIATVVAASPFFPPPSTIVVQTYKLWFSGPVTTLFTTELFWRDVVPSIGRALLGWLIASAIGVLIGSIAGQWRKAAAFIDPPVDFIRSLPKPALVPIFLIILGGGDAMRLAFIIVGCVPPVLLNAMQSVRAIDPTYKETAKAFHTPALRTYFRIILPAAAPGIFAGMRISLSLALILMVVSEWMLVNTGLGYYLLDSQRQFRLPDMWSAMLLLGVLGYLLNVAFVAVEKRLLRWHRSTTVQ